MTKRTQNTNLGGRPKSYVPDLVHKIVLEFIEDGVSVSEIDGAMVKNQLCEHHGVSKQIRPEPLQELVEAILAEISDEERQSLLASLPEGIASAIDDAMATAGRELLLLVARQNTACKSAADAECEVLRADKRNANWRIAKLESELKERSLELSNLEQERDAALAHAEKLAEERDAALNELDRLGRDTSTVDRLLTELRDPAIRGEIRAAIAEIAATPEPATQRM